MEVVMSKRILPLAVVSAVIAFMYTAAPARALNDHSWVSATGSGTACTRTAPCTSFQAAHDATNAGGVISVLDSGDFGAVTINKSLTIRAEGADGGSVAASSGGAAFIVVIAGPSDVVQLEGL